MSEEREARFFEAIRRGLANGAPLPHPGPRPAPPEIREDLAERFCEELREAGGRATLVPGWSDLPAALARWVDELRAGRQEGRGRAGGPDESPRGSGPGGPLRILRWDDPRLEEAGVDDTLRRCGVEVLVWPVSLDPAASADAGITWADYGIAFTGTLVLFHDPRKGRQVSLLPPVHLAILSVDDLLPHSHELFRRLDAGELAVPSNLTFVSGPSKTADIEQTLAIGVHGPGQLDVFVVRESLGRVPDK